MPTKPIILPTQINLDEFISIEAHDLRTPFNHVIGFSKMTLNTVGDAPLTAFQKEDLGTVYRSGMRALNYMNGLIDIARINRKEKELHLNEVDIQQILDQSISQWKKFHPGAEVEIETIIHASSPTIQLDDQTMRQVFAGFIAYTALYCEGKTIVTLTVEEEAGRIIFMFTSVGAKALQPSKLDLDILGFTNRAYVELHAGAFLKAEENDQGACIQFTLPKI
jgi:signal transduction histidine kinase